MTLNPFVPMLLALSLVTTWVNGHGLSLLVFGSGEVGDQPCVKCSIWGGMVVGAHGCGGLFSLGKETIQEGSATMRVFSLASGKAHFQGKLRVSIWVLMQCLLFIFPGDNPPVR